MVATAYRHRGAAASASPPKPLPRNEETPGDRRQAFFNGEELVPKGK